MRMTGLAIVLIAVSTSFASLPASAAMQCGPRDKIAAALGEKFHENRKSLGIANQSAVIELFVSVRGSWTITATNTKGLACIIASGEAWQDHLKVVAGAGS